LNKKKKQSGHGEELRPNMLPSYLGSRINAAKGGGKEQAGGRTKKNINSAQNFNGRHAKVLRSTQLRKIHARGNKNFKGGEH